MRACVWVLAFGWILSFSLATGSRADDLSLSDIPLEEVPAFLNNPAIVMPFVLYDRELAFVRFDTKALYPVDLDLLIQLQVAKFAFEGIQPASVTYESSFEFELGNESDPLAPLLDRKSDPLEVLRDPLQTTDVPTIDGF